MVFDNESLLSVGGFPTATSTGSDLAAIAAAAGVPRTATVRTLEEFSAAFAEALQANDLTTIVAKVEAVGPPRYVTDLSLLENRYQFAALISTESSRHGRNSRMSLLTQLVAELNAGTLKVVDLTQPLGPETPVIGLPPMFGSSPGVSIEVISRYRRQGPRAGTGTPSAWGSTPGTHFDAPVHWITGKDLPTTPATPFRPGASWAQPA